jgi:flagellar biosynthesis/type III secretory pathway chaperone
MHGSAATPGQELSELVEELREVLEEERQALLSGTPEIINAATHRKMLVADRIEQATVLRGAVRPDRGTLLPLIRYNQENAVICAAMLRHLTAAIDRLRRHDPHRSYNAEGREETRSARHALGAA